MMSFLSAQRSATAFVTRQAAFRTNGVRAIGSTALRNAEAGQAEVVLVGCGAPNRGTFLTCQEGEPPILADSTEVFSEYRPCFLEAGSL